MTITDLSVVNRALTRLRIPPLKTMTEPGPVGDAVRVSFTGIRQALLRRHPWRFAMARARLGSVTPHPPFGWRYSHPLPKARGGTPGSAGYVGPWLRFHGVWAPPPSGELFDEREPQTPHTVEGPFLYANVTPVFAKYIADVPTSFPDSLFAEALVFALAEELALALKQSTELAEQMASRFQEVMISARSANAFDATPPPAVYYGEPSALAAYYV